MSFIRTNSRHLVTAAGIVGYLYLPVAYWLWLCHELAAGSFPVNADSIGIPMVGFVFLWILLPILVAGVFAVSKVVDRYRRFK